MTTPFPGESLRCNDVWSSADGWIEEDVSLRGGVYPTSDGHRVIAAGVDWYCYTARYYSPSYLDPGDTTPLAVSWVVEVLSGSGTLDLWDYEDIGFGWPTDPGSYPNHVGTINVSGAGTYLLPTTSFSNDSIAAAGDDRSLALRLACTAGGIDVQQVKLRAWPATGPSATLTAAPYTEDPGYTGTPSFSAFIAVSDESDLATAQAVLAAQTLSTPTTAPPEAGPHYLMAGGEQNTLSTISSYAKTGGVAYITRPDNIVYSPPGLEGVDWIRPPEEVERDANDVRFDPTGPDVIEWTQPEVTVELYTRFEDAGGPVWAGTVRLGADAIAETDPPTTTFGSVSPGTPLASWTPTGAVEPILHTVTLPEVPSGQVLRLILSNTGDEVDEGDGGSLGILYRGSFSDYAQTDYAGLQYHVQPAPYRYWVPGPAAEPSVLRWWPRNDGLRATSPARHGQQSSYQSGRGGGYQ